MKNSFQDDYRESEMIELFKLVKDTSEGRYGVDAFLELEGNNIPFELKTTSKGSVTTVRDFGPAHIEKWQGKHWLFGFYQGVRYSQEEYGQILTNISSHLLDNSNCCQVSFIFLSTLGSNKEWLYILLIKFV